VVHILVSYFISGAIKLKSASWRNGSDLQVFLKASVIIVPKFLRTGIGKAPKLISIAVAIFEVVLPFLFLNRISFGFALGAGIFFHLANFFLFGLNRFFWAWLAAYPSLLWLHRIIS
jgi:hypothetical protein